MSRFRGPAPGDTDRRGFYRPMHPEARGRPFRGPRGERPPWADRPDWPRRPPPADWPPPRPAPVDWDDRPPPPPTHWTQEGALGVLNSCGLDATDLSLLAELPEDMLTLKSLPQLLSQIKQKKDPYLPPGPEPLPPIDPPRDLYPGPAPRPLDPPGLYHDPGPSVSPFPSAPAPGIVVDYEHRASDVDFRKSRSRSPPGISQGSKEWGQRKPPSVPTETQARDFHGMKPKDFPYSCSLCDITVLSENVWTQHINTTLHADRQLSLLQRFPTWDCRVESARRDGKQALKQEKKTKKEAKEAKPKKGKVICVKFPAKGVDETYLRNLTKDFGQIINVAMFPSLGFIEMQEPEQAQNLIDSFSLSPHKVDDQELEFSISTTFNFLQSSFVLNFFPVPFGNEGKRDLLAIIKRFGTPLYTMFITDTMHAYVEMEHAADAHKMVEYYSTTPLKMNGVNIIVSFSQEFRTLARCARAKPYEENEENKPEPVAPKPAAQKQVVVKKKVVKKMVKKKTVAKTPAKEATEKTDQPESEGEKKDEATENPEAEGKEPKNKEATGEAEEGSDMEIDAGETSAAMMEEEEEEEVEEEVEEIEEVEEEVIEEEEDDPGMPFNLENCITLDEVSDDNAPKEEEDDESLEDENAARVVYIGNLPLCRFSDPQFIKMVALVHRPVRYFINRQLRMGLAEFTSRRQAREFVAKMQDYCFGGCCLTTYISNKHKRLPWGRGVEYDEAGRIMRHFKIGKSPERKSPPPSLARHFKRDSPRSMKRRSRSRGRMRGRSRDRSRGKSRDRFRRRSRDRSRGKSKDRSLRKSRSRDRSGGKPRVRSRSRDRSRRKSRGRSRSRGRSKGRSRSRGKSRDRSRGRSRDRSRSRRGKSRSPSSKNKPTGESEASKETNGDLKIENVASMGSGDGAEVGVKAETEAEVKDGQMKEREDQEEGWTVANLNPDKEDDMEKMEEGEKKEAEKEKKDETGDDGKGPVKKSGANEAKVPTKPIGTEFIRFYCALCHVMYSDQQEARAHCSTLPHYNKYKEMTGKDPWSASD